MYGSYHQVGLVTFLRLQVFLQVSISPVEICCPQFLLSMAGPHIWYLPNLATAPRRQLSFVSETKFHEISSMGPVDILYPCYHSRVLCPLPHALPAELCT